MASSSVSFCWKTRTVQVSTLHRSNSPCSVVPLCKHHRHWRCNFAYIFHPPQQLHLKSYHFVSVRGVPVLVDDVHGERNGKYIRGNLV
jgi:hypothetical protein